MLSQITIGRLTAVCANTGPTYVPSNPVRFSNANTGLIRFLPHFGRLLCVQSDRFVQEDMLPTFRSRYQVARITRSKDTVLQRFKPAIAVNQDLAVWFSRRAPATSQNFRLGQAV